MSPRFSCNFCPALFNTSNGLNKHIEGHIWIVAKDGSDDTGLHDESEDDMLRQDETSKSDSFEDCDNSLNSLDMDNHVSGNDDDDDELTIMSFRCSQCRKTFVDEKDFRQHIFDVHKSGKKQNTSKRHKATTFKSTSPTAIDKNRVARLVKSLQPLDRDQIPLRSPRNLRMPPLNLLLTYADNILSFGSNLDRDCTATPILAKKRNSLENTNVISSEKITSPKAQTSTTDLSPSSVQSKENSPPQRGNNIQTADDDHSKPFKCQYCPQRFSIDAKLRLHLQTGHVDKRHIKCDFCPNTFSHDNYLQQHLTIVHNDIQQLHQQQLEQQQLQQQHLEHQQLQQQQLLQKHIQQQQLQQKHLQKPQQQQQLQQQHHLQQQHLQKQQQQQHQQQPSATTTVKSPDSVSRNMGAIFKCGICSLAFSDIENLSLHIKSEHSKRS